MLPVEPDEPVELAMFPLESVLLPGDDLPLRIFEPRYTALVRDCLDSDDPRFGVVLISRGREVGGGEGRCEVGALAKIAECIDAGAGRYVLSCRVGNGSGCATGCPTTLSASRRVGLAGRTRNVTGDRCPAARRRRPGAGLVRADRGRPRCRVAAA